MEIPVYPLQSSNTCPSFGWGFLFHDLWGSFFLETVSSSSLGMFHFPGDSAAHGNSYIGVQGRLEARDPVEPIWTLSAAGLWGMPSVLGPAAGHCPPAPLTKPCSAKQRQSQVSVAEAFLRCDGYGGFPGLAVASEYGTRC